MWFIWVNKTVTRTKRVIKFFESRKRMVVHMFYVWKLSQNQSNSQFLLQPVTLICVNMLSSIMTGTYLQKWTAFYKRRRHSRSVSPDHIMRRWVWRLRLPVFLHQNSTSQLTLLIPWLSLLMKRWCLKFKKWPFPLQWVGAACRSARFQIWEW